MLTVITSGKSAPGVTTSTWALALAWPRPVLAADCDPVGGDMAAGLLPGRVSLDRGLLSWSSTARRGTPALSAAAMLAAHAVELPEHPSVWLLPGFTNATQGHSFTEDVWERLALALQRSSAAIGRDAIVDTGRLVGDQVTWPLLHAADQVLVVVRPSVRSVHSAQQATSQLRRELGDLTNVGVLVVGDGPYSSTEVSSALGLALAGTLPTDRRAAAALSDGASATMRTLHRSALLKAAASLAHALTAGHDCDPADYAPAEATR
jgi:MinD-like ATPase involved in chromosome partitioning or flagellar assembly